MFSTLEAKNQAFSSVQLYIEIHRETDLGKPTSNLELMNRQFLPK